MYERPKRLSPIGVKRLGAEEWSGANGLRTDGRYYTYLDYKGFPTIGIGHLVKPGDDFSKGLTLDGVTELFHHDLGDVYAAISRNVSYEFNQAEFDSLVCTGHNCGPGFFVPANCTAIRCLNASDVEGYCTHLLDWNKSGVPLRYDPILFARRQREAAWFKEVRTDALTVAESDQIMADVQTSLRDAVDPTELGRSEDNP